MKKIIGPIVALLVLIAAYTIILGWERYDYPEEGFSIKLPDEPRETQFPDPTDKLDGLLYLYSVGYKDCAYLVMHAKLLPKNRDKIDLNAFFQAGAMGGVFRQGMGTVGFDREKKPINGHPGIEIKAKMQQGLVNVKARARFYFVGDRMFVVMVMGKKKDYSSWNATRFLNSFQLIEE